MAYGDIGAVIQTLEYETLNSEYQQILHVAGNVYAIAHQRGGTIGVITTVAISDAGVITVPVIATFTFEAGYAWHIRMIHVAGNVFAIVAHGAGYRGTCYTVSISDDGLTISVIETEVFDAAAGFEPSIAHVTGTIYAIAHAVAAATSATVRTLSISAAGVIGSVLDTLVIDATNGYKSAIINISDSIVAIAYNSTSYVIKVVTVAIGAAGEMGVAVEDTVTIDTADTWSNLHMAKALGDAVLVAYQGPGGDGWAKSITITAAGVICASPIDSIEFDIADCDRPHILHIGLGICAIVYRGVLTDGFVVTVEVDAAGAIKDTIDDTLEFDTNDCNYPNIAHVAGDIYAVAASGLAADGYVTTLDISTPPVGAPHHEMLMGMGP